MIFFGIGQEGEDGGGRSSDPGLMSDLELFSHLSLLDQGCDGNADF
jgi:hypothetical protein